MNYKYCNRNFRHCKEYPIPIAMLAKTMQFDLLALKGELSVIHNNYNFME